MKLAYVNVSARKAALEKTSSNYQHLMMSSVLKLAKSPLMASFKSA